MHHRQGRLPQLYLPNHVVSTHTVATSFRGLTLGALDAEGRPRLAIPSVCRNGDCPCASGRKYKRCHGLYARHAGVRLPASHGRLSRCRAHAARIGSRWRTRPRTRAGASGRPRPRRAAGRLRLRPATATASRAASSACRATRASSTSVVLNNSTTDQTLRVTLYQADFNARKEPVDPPGPLTLTLQPGVTSGRAFSVGVKAELHIGRYYELVVEMDDARLLPSIQVWDTEGATVIPGTLIPPGAFVEL